MWPHAHGHTASVTAGLQQCALRSASGQQPSIACHGRARRRREAAVDRGLKGLSPLGHTPYTGWGRVVWGGVGVSRESVVSLFSGAGGMSLGFTQAGFAPALSADVDADACATYARNLGGAIRNVDLSRPDPAFEAELRGHRGAFALIGGPPCQGFSSAGGKRGDDERNRLIFNYFHIVDLLRPRWFLFENVEGLLTSDGGGSVVELVRRFVRSGYRVRLEKVNFASYGLPQARKRVLLVGNSLNLDFDLPPASHSFNAGKHKVAGLLPVAPSFDEATGGLGPTGGAARGPTNYGRASVRGPYEALMREGNDAGGVTLHYAPPVSDGVRAIIHHLAPGQTMKDVPEALWHDSYRKRANRRVADGTPTERRGGAPSGVKRLRGDLNALTVTGAATREFIHPDEDRPLTLREAARLQSFPDRYQFEGGTASVAQQIGNAFPPLAADVLARHLATLDATVASPAAANSTGGLIGFRLTDALGMSPALARTHSLLVAMAQRPRQMGFDYGDREAVHVA